MQREDQFSEDVIKIFHNSKGSLKNKIMEWTNDYEALQIRNHHTNQWEMTDQHSPFNHAAGDYEPIHRDDPLLHQDGRNHAAKLSGAFASDSQPHQKEKESKIYGHPNQSTEK